MTQPSVSQHIQALERHFDMPLFLRNGRSLELTDARMALLPLAREAIALSVNIDETIESLKPNDDAKCGRASRKARTPELPSKALSEK